MNPVPAFIRPFSGKPLPGGVPLRDYSRCGFHHPRDSSRYYCAGWQSSLSMDSVVRRCHFFRFGLPSPAEVASVQSILSPVSALSDLVPVTEWEKTNLISRVLREKASAEGGRVLTFGTTALVTSGVKSQFETNSPEKAELSTSGGLV